MRVTVTSHNAKENLVGPFLARTLILKVAGERVVARNGPIYV